MSQIQPRELKTVVTKDPLVDFCEEVFIVEKSASNSQDFPVVSNNYSSSQTSFTINLNSRDAVIDRGFVLQQPLSLTVSLDTPLASGPILIPNRWSFRDFPINRMASTITLSIGNVSVTAQVSDLTGALARTFISDNTKYTAQGNSITMQEQLKYISNGINSSRSPYNQFNSGGLDNVVPRGAYDCVVTTSGSPTQTQTINTTLYEPLFISPLIKSLKDRVIGFTHLTQILVNITWCADPSRMIAINNPNVNLVTNPYRLELVWGQPRFNILQLTDPLMIPPSVVSYAYNMTDRYTTDFQTPADNNNFSTFSVATQNVQLSSIPKYCLIYAQPNFNVLKPQVASHFLPIQSLQLNFNNVTYLTSCDAPTLYKYSVQNGVDMSWQAWSGLALSNNFRVPTVGSVLCLAFGSQIPLPSQFAPSTSVKCNISANVQFYNQDGYTSNEFPQQTGTIVRDYTLFMAFVYDNSISLFGSNSGSTSTAALSELDVLQAQKESPQVHYGELNTHGFGGRMDNFVTSGKLKSLLRGGKVHSGAMSKAESSVMDAMGEGVATRFAEYRGAGMTGGKRLSRSAMKKQLLG
jgi:hypothetical protein